MGIDRIRAYRDEFTKTRQRLFTAKENKRLNDYLAGTTARNREIIQGVIIEFEKAIISLNEINLAVLQMAEEMERKAQKEDVRSQ